jgi:hypothetical protein
MSSGNSYNGWPANSDPSAIGVVQSQWFPGGAKAGDVTTVLGYVATQLDARVEPIVGGWCWGYTYKANVNNPSSLSCHASGTAIDYNAPDHPNGSGGTFTDAQVGTIYAILDEVQGAVDWLEGYDEMHFEIAVNATDLAAVAASLGGGGTGPGPSPVPIPEGDTMQLIQADSGNGAIFAFGSGRFIHVPGPGHLDLGTRTGLWDGSVRTCSLSDLDVLRDCCCGNSTTDTPDAKGVNLTTRLPSDLASA